MKVWRLFADGCSCVPSGRLRGLERVEKSQTRGHTEPVGRRACGNEPRKGCAAQGCRGRLGPVPVAPKGSGLQPEVILSLGDTGQCLGTFWVIIAGVGSAVGIGG